jgi:hypothetical protein
MGANVPTDFLTRSEVIPPDVYQGLRQELETVPMVDFDDNESPHGHADYLDIHMLPSLIVSPPKDVPREPDLTLTGSSPASQSTNTSTQQIQQFISSLPPRRGPTQDKVYRFEAAPSVGGTSLHQHSTRDQQPICNWDHQYTPSYRPDATSREPSEKSYGRRSSGSVSKRQPQQCPDCLQVLANKDGLA